MLLSLLIQMMVLAGCAVAPTAPPPTAPPSATAVLPTSAVVEPIAAPTSAPEERLPLKDAVKSMDPQDVWQNFYNLTQIPRASENEGPVREFLVQFGKGLKLETLVDEAGNVLIRKPAASGMENLQGVVLQVHTDMVTEKTADKVIDLQ